MRCQPLITLATGCGVVMLWTAAAHATPPPISGIAADEVRHLVTKDGHRVSYDNDATDADAQALATALKDLGYFGDSRESHVLLRGNTKRGRSVSFITVEGSWKKPVVASSFRFISEVLAARVFHDQQMRVHVCDATIVCHLTIAPQGRLGRWVPTRNHNAVFFRPTAHNATDVATKTAEIGEVLSAWTDRNGLTRGLMFVSENDTGRASFCLAIVDERLANNPAVLKQLQTISNVLSERAYAGRPVHAYICDTALEPRSGRPQ